jgi:hypothetical protein
MDEVRTRRARPHCDEFSGLETALRTSGLMRAWLEEVVRAVAAAARAQDFQGSFAAQPQSFDSWIAGFLGVEGDPDRLSIKGEAASGSC